VKRVAFLLLQRVELVDGDDAPAVAGDEDQDVGLVDAEFLGAAAVLINVEHLLGDAAGGAILGGVDVFVDQAADLGVVAFGGG
jgi:hypothetical protein